jgi:hypothetical protein
MPPAMTSAYATPLSSASLVGSTCSSLSCIIPAPTTLQSILFNHTHGSQSNQVVSSNGNGHTSNSLTTDGNCNMNSNNNSSNSCSSVIGHVNVNMNMNGSIVGSVSSVECSSVVSRENEWCDVHCLVSSSSSSSSASSVSLPMIGKPNSINGTTMNVSGWRSESGSTSTSASISGSPSISSSESGCNSTGYGNGNCSVNTGTVKSSNGINGICRTGSSPSLESSQLYWNNGVLCSKSSGGHSSADSISSSSTDGSVSDNGNSEELKSHLCLVDQISQIECDRSVKEVDNRISYIEQENAYLQSIVTDTYQQMYQLQQEHTIVGQHIERNRKTIEEMNSQWMAINKYANDLKATLDVYALNSLHQLNINALQQLEDHYRQGLEHIQVAMDRLSTEAAKDSLSVKEEGAVGESGTGSLSKRCASMSMCWVCSRNQVSVVCMPCRHQVCCGVCACCLPRCPHCQKTVSHTIPLYTSLPTFPRPPPSPTRPSHSAHVSPPLTSISPYPGSSAYSALPSAAHRIPMPSALASLLALDPASTTMRLYAHPSTCSPPISPPLIPSSSTSTSISSSPGHSRWNSRHCSIEEQSSACQSRLSHRFNAYCTPSISGSLSSGSTTEQSESTTISVISVNVSSATTDPTSTAKRSNGDSSIELQFNEGTHTRIDTNTGTSTNVSSYDNSSFNKPTPVHVQSNVATVSTSTGGENGNSDSPSKYNNQSNSKNSSNGGVQSMNMCGIVEYGVVDSRQGYTINGNSNGSGNSSTNGSVSSTPLATIRLLPLS